MSKFTTLMAITVLLSLTLAQGARRNTKLTSDSADVKAQKALTEESCEGVGEDECLTRRTLAAHLDYIYTQEENHP